MKVTLLTKNVNQKYMQWFIPYRAANTLILGYKNQTVIVAVRPEKLYKSRTITYNYSAAIRDVSDFLWHVDEVLAFLSCYITYVGICLTKFRDGQPVPSSTAKHSL
jgi:hypothetical protein